MVGRIILILPLPPSCCSKEVDLPLLNQDHVTLHSQIDHTRIQLQLRQLSKSVGKVTNKTGSLCMVSDEGSEDSKILSVNKVERSLSRMKR